MDLEELELNGPDTEDADEAACGCHCPGRDEGQAGRG
jgi:hypothetical protein